MKNEEQVLSTGRSTGFVVVQLKSGEKLYMTDAEFAAWLARESKPSKKEKTDA